MKKTLLFFSLASAALSFRSSAQESDSLLLQQELYQQTLDSIDRSFSYQTGEVKIKDFAVINIPKGYKYLDAEQSNYVLTKLWGNPPDSSSLGMIFREDLSPLNENRWAIDVTYSEEGYIKDDDAEDINYDDLLKEIQKDGEESNKERLKAGYEPIYLVGWAAKPFYDNENKKLHWAKELKFGDSASASVLNYNIRILGRKGYLILNAIGSMDQLPEISKDINKVISAAEFTDGSKYSEFNPDLDKVAAYGIGGLIAGKVLAKVGLLALVIKFWKLLVFGAIGLFAFFRKKIFGEKPTPSFHASDPESIK